MGGTCRRYSALSLALVVSLLVLSRSANARALPSQCPPNKLVKAHVERRAAHARRGETLGGFAWASGMGMLQRMLHLWRQADYGRQADAARLRVLGDTDLFMRGGCPGRRRTLFAFMSLAV